jgi:hypothetical protein
MMCVIRRIDAETPLCIEKSYVPAYVPAMHAAITIATTAPFMVNFQME